jgi:tRNA-modifying protein YgfZ
VSAIVGIADAAVIELTGTNGGPGAVTTFQGLLTNDLEKPGDAAFVYGALLTPKGMVVVDGWAARSGARVRFTTPVEGRERVLDILQKSVPPRLARFVDRSDELAVVRIAGEHATGIVEAAGLPVPEPGRIAEVDVKGTSAELARTAGTQQAPFHYQVTLAAGQAPALVTRLAGAGARPADAATFELARVLAGWPRLANEVDEKTLPQEIRYDEIGGVSYTKGCYTGQETVSRLHFRGHANRQLRGLLFEADPAAPPATGWSGITHEDREVGRVTSVAWAADASRWIGLAVIRREVPLGAVVRAAGREARVVALPFDLPGIRPA